MFSKKKREQKQKPTKINEKINIWAQKKKKKHVGGEVQCEWYFWELIWWVSLSLSFLLILERIFWWAYFHFSLPNQKHSKKSFPFYFFSKVFHSSYFASKQTHPYILYLLSRVTPTRLWNQHIMWEMMHKIIIKEICIR